MRRAKAKRAPAAPPVLVETNYLVTWRSHFAGGSQSHQIATAVACDARLVWRALQAIGAPDLEIRAWSSGANDGAGGYVVLS